MMTKKEKAEMNKQIDRLWSAIEELNEKVAKLEVKKPCQCVKN